MSQATIWSAYGAATLLAAAGSWLLDPQSTPRGRSVSDQSSASYSFTQRPLLRDVIDDFKADAAWRDGARMFVDSHLTPVGRGWTLPPAAQPSTEPIVSVEAPEGLRALKITLWDGIPEDENCDLHVAPLPTGSGWDVKVTRPLWVAPLTKDVKQVNLSFWCRRMFNYSAWSEVVGIKLDGGRRDFTQANLERNGEELRWSLEQFDFAVALKQVSEGSRRNARKLNARRVGEATPVPLSGSVSVDAVHPVDTVIVTASDRYTALLVLSDQPLKNRATSRIAGADAYIGRSTCSDRVLAAVADEWQNIELQLTATQPNHPFAYRVLALSDERPPYAELLGWFVGHDLRWVFGDDKRLASGDDCIRSISSAFAVSSEAFDPAAAPPTIDSAHLAEEFLKTLHRTVKGDDDH